MFLNKVTKQTYVVTQSFMPEFTDNLRSNIGTDRS